MTPKNWLFLGSERGGKLTAIACTLIENSKHYGFDLRSYLTITMKRPMERAPESAPRLTPKALVAHPKKLANQVAG